MYFSCASLRTWQRVCPNPYLWFVSTRTKLLNNPTQPHWLFSFHGIFQSPSSQPIQAPSEWREWVYSMARPIPRVYLTHGRVLMGREVTFVPVCVWRWAWFEADVSLSVKRLPAPDNYRETGRVSCWDLTQKQVVLLTNSAPSLRQRADTAGEGSAILLTWKTVVDGWGIN